VSAAFIAGQVTFCVVLLFGAALLIRSYWNLSRVSLGFEKRGVLTFWLTPSESRRLSGEIATSRHSSFDGFYARLDRGLRAIPGVQEVATSFDLPTAGRSFETPITREGSTDTPRDRPHVGVQMTSPRLFATLGMTLREGRDFDEHDGEGAPRVAIVNEAFAAGALGAGRWLETFVLGVNPRDPTTLVLVSALFLAVTALAAYGPARRASLLDPAGALR